MDKTRFKHTVKSSHNHRHLNMAKASQSSSRSISRTGGLRRGVMRRSSSTPDLSSFSSSPIFTTGKLLHTIQMSNLYQDSKTFVDMTTRLSEQEVLSNFDKLLLCAGETPSREQLSLFVEENFFEVGYDLVKVEPKDWHESAPFLSHVTDDRLVNFGRFLNCKWRSLLRSFDGSKVSGRRGATTALCTKNSFIVPGGRFIEYYYWDTFWIVEGLLSSGMVHTTRGIIENFLDIVKTHGFVPNGSRVYYLNRSQPPLLTQMVDAYFKHTNDIKFLADAIDQLDTEYDYWMKKKAIKIGWCLFFLFF
jgi:alpha,alpha-trehalase